MDDLRGTLAWLDDSLEKARSGDRERPVNLLSLVRAEILFDMALSESPTQNGATVLGPGFGPDGRA